jgi:hypothetical protein
MMIPTTQPTLPHKAQVGRVMALGKHIESRKTDSQILELATSLANVIRIADVVMPVL